MVATLAATLILSIIGPAVSAAKGPPGLRTFMHAMGKIESGGNHNARNPFSGAFGKYQIMPSNWPSWAAAYIGNRQLVEGATTDLDHALKLQMDRVDLGSRLEAMNVLQYRIRQLEKWREDRPWSVFLV